MSRDWTSQQNDIHKVWVINSGKLLNTQKAFEEAEKNSLWGAYEGLVPEERGCKGHLKRPKCF